MVGGRTLSEVLEGDTRLEVIGVSCDMVGGWTLSEVLEGENLSE